MAMTICKLCKKNTTLLKRSHIIPDFYYRECRLYDENHQLELLQANRTTRKIEHHKIQNSGIYDKGILCSTCDNKVLGKLESYLRPLLFGGIIGIEGNPTFKNFIDPKGKKYIQCTNISYIKAKLGLLSILWRASISQNPFFKDVKLGAELEEELRIMLLENDPKEITKIPIICLSIVSQKEFFQEVIAQPRKLDDSHGSGFAFLLGGMFLLYYLTHNFTLEQLEYQSISPNKCMTIIQIDDGDGLDWIMSFLGLHKKQ
jgi:hypothetical protein